MSVRVNTHFQEHSFYNVSVCVSVIFDLFYPIIIRTVILLYDYDICHCVTVNANVTVRYYISFRIPVGMSFNPLVCVAAPHRNEGIEANAAHAFGLIAY
eukprot:sb/3478615/